MPAFTLEPVSQTVLEGSTVNFTLAVTGSGPFTYYWRINGRYYAMTSSTTLTIPNARLSDQANYSVVVLGAAGAVTSSNAFLTVLRPRNLSASRRHQQRECQQQLDLGGDGHRTAPIRYQWRKDNVNIPNATNFNYIISSVQIPDEGDYQVVVTDAMTSLLNTNVVSQPSQLIPLVSITTVLGPTNQTVLAGSTVIIPVAISGYPPSFRFELRKSSLVLQTLTTSQSNCVFTLPNVQLSDEANNYRSS